MDLTFTYAIAQIFVVINYTLLIITYQLKNRKTIVILSFITVLATLLSYIFLSAKSGVAMTIVAIIRSIMFMLDKNKSDKIVKKDVINLIILYSLSIVLAIFTYEELGSLLVVFITILYTFSIWQKNTKIYKMLGIPIGILGIMYNFYIHSIFGIFFETLLTIFAFIGLIRDVKTKD